MCQVCHFPALDEEPVLSEADAPEFHAPNHCLPLNFFITFFWFVRHRQTPQSLRRYLDRAPSSAAPSPETNAFPDANFSPLFDNLRRLAGVSGAGVPGTRGFSRDGVEAREPAAEILSGEDASQMRSVHEVERYLTALTTRRPLPSARQTEEFNTKSNLLNTLPLTILLSST